MSKESRITAGSAAMERLVERQMRNWELARTQRLDAERAAGQEVADFICISRMVGAGGGGVAQAVSERLGWPLFDRELLQSMAGDDGIRKQIYASMDERDVGWCEETLRSLMQPEFGRNDYFHRLTETVLGIARQGNAVFMGRGIDLILPRDLGLRVRLNAPSEVCVHNYAQRGRTTLEHARSEIHRLEREQSDFIRRYFRIEPSSVDRFDMLINLATITPRTAANLVVAAHHELRAEAKAKS